MKSVVSSSTAGPRTARTTLVLAVAICLGAVLPAWAQRAPTLVQRITASTVGSEAVITIEANGPLPAPTIGTVDGPPRIFLDFPGVRTTTSGLARAADRRIVRVRAAINSVSPLVTRVVLDLTSPQPHRLEQATGRVMIFVGASTRAAAPTPLPIPDSAPVSAQPAPRTAARRTVPSSNTTAHQPAGHSGWPAASAPVPSDAPATAPPRAPAAVPSGAASSFPMSTPAADTAAVPAPPPTSMTAPPPPIPLVPPLPDPPPPSKRGAAAQASRAPADAAGAGGASNRSTSRAPALPPPSKDVERYRTSVSPLLLRLRMQQPLLESVGSLEDQAPARMHSAMEEFDNLRQELSAVKPPETLKPQHDLLMQATRLGMTAARLSVESIKSRDSAVVRNAASAATGAILMLDRACVDLGCPGPPGR